MSHTWKDGFEHSKCDPNQHERMVLRYPGQERDDGWTQRIELAKRAAAMQQGTPEFKKLEEDFANVSAPLHYRFRGGLQTIDLIHEVLEKQQDGFLAYCLGNIFKYLTRFGRKDGLQDMKKALRYLAWAVEHVEKGSISHE